MSCSELGWLAVAGVVLGYDAFALATGRETLSSAYWRWQRRNPFQAGALNGLSLALWWHLASGGQRRLLPLPAHAAYRRVHPLWLVHDALQRPLGDKGG